MSTFNVNMSIAEHLIFKDKVFKQIYGFYPKKIINNNGRITFVECGTVTLSNRTNYHTQAELLFGYHNCDTIETWIKLKDNIIDAIFDISKLLVPDEVESLVDMYQILFFSSSILEVLDGTVKTLISFYIDDTVSNIIDLFEWTRTIMAINGNINDLKNITNRGNIKIYNKVADQEYNTYFISGEELISIEEIIDCIS